MIRTSNSIATRFDRIAKSKEDIILSHLKVNQEGQSNLLKILSEKFTGHADAINNQGKQLSAEDIKFYGKIHFDRDRSESNEGNMHCHIIVSRKDQSNKIKLSPLTNHKNTKKGIIKGEFDRVNLFQKSEVGFDSIFNYNRPLDESFEYYNTMKNGTITEQIKMQERMNTFTNSLQHDVMSSVSLSCNQSAIQKREEAENKQNIKEQRNRLRF